MKRHDHRYTRSWSYNSLELFREDLEEVLRLFNHRGTLMLRDDEAEYDSFDEMRRHKGDRINQLVILSTSPGIVLELKSQPKKLNLYTVDANDDADVAFFKTHEFLHPKFRRLYRFLELPIFAAVYMAVAEFVSFKVHPFDDVFKKREWLSIPVIFLALLLGMLTTVRVSEKTALFLSLARRSESKSFWVRKKDDILLALLGAVAGGLITEGARFLVEHFTKP